MSISRGPDSRTMYWWRLVSGCHHRDHAKRSSFSSYLLFLLALSGRRSRRAWGRIGRDQVRDINPSLFLELLSNIFLFRSAESNISEMDSQLSELKQKPIEVRIQHSIWIVILPHIYLNRVYSRPQISKFVTKKLINQQKNCLLKSTFQRKKGKHHLCQILQKLRILITLLRLHWIIPDHAMYAKSTPFTGFSFSLLLIS
jgi:hypothetical protein